MFDWIASMSYHMTLTQAYLHPIPVQLGQWRKNVYFFQGKQNRYLEHLNTCKLSPSLCSIRLARTGGSWYYFDLDL